MWDWGRKTFAAGCISHLCHGWISLSNLLIFGRLIFVCCKGSVSFEAALPSFFMRAKVCDFQFLIRSFAVTHCHLHIHMHTKTLLNQDSGMIHTFILCTGICILLLGEGEHILASWLCAYIPSFPSSLSACLPPLLFVTNQPTFFSYIFRALFHALHDPPSTVSSPLVHILVTLVLLSPYYVNGKEFCLRGRIYFCCLSCDFQLIQELLIYFKCCVGLIFAIFSQLSGLVAVERWCHVFSSAHLI